MSTMINAYAVTKAGGDLQPFSYDAGPLGATEVEIAVSSCGICHSDMSMLDNEWGMSAYPLVPGHEVIGEVITLGAQVTGLKMGQRVGLGWFSGSCQQCRPCLSGHQNLCAESKSTIVGRHGGFADKVRADALWVVPIPDGVDPASAGPLFCGGATVFSPMVEYGVSPMDRVGIIGIGGLGHLALQFARAWGCEVWAFTTSDDKIPEAKAMGAHHVANTRSKEKLRSLSGKFDFILNTAAADLPYPDYMRALAPLGRMVNVAGYVEKPIQVGAFDLIGGQKQLGGSSMASPIIVKRMLEFCARHKIAPVTEYYPMEKANEAMAHLRSGKARYRVVLTR